MPPTDAVFFDLDNTLCVSNQSDEDIHREAFERAGIDPFVSLQDIRAVESAEIATAESDTEFYRNLYQAALGDSSPDPDPGVLTELAEATVDVIDQTDVSFRDGAEAALMTVRERYDVGLITNGGRETQAAKLDALGIDDVFDATVFCDPSAGIEPKPSREPFQMALSRLDVSADRSLYVGDDFSADVVGAHEAGLRPVWAPLESDRASQQRNPDPDPAHVLDSMAELPAIL